MKRRLTLFLIIAVGLLRASLAPSIVAGATAPFGSELFQLTASDPSPDQAFANSVAVSGRTVLVGAPYDHVFPTHGGSVYVYDVTTGVQTRKLIASDTMHQDAFGISVATDGSKAIVGASGSLIARGSAYIFNASTGQELRKLTASNGNSGDVFGLSVAIEGNTAIVGAPAASGRTYIYDVTTGQEQFILSAPLIPFTLTNNFGSSVALSGNRAIVGAPSTTLPDNPPVTGPGAAYVFDVTTGKQLLRLTASDAAEADWFGGSVGISGNLAVVAATGAVHEGLVTGAAYLFDVSTGQQIAKLVADDAAEGTNFGVSVAINDHFALIGADRDASGFNSGAAYLFDLETHRQVQKLFASDAGEGHHFGWASSMTGTRAIIGAWGANELNGAAYMFSVPEPASVALVMLCMPLLVGRCARRSPKHGGALIRADESEKAPYCSPARHHSRRSVCAPTGDDVFIVTQTAFDPKGRSMMSSTDQAKKIWAIVIVLSTASLVACAPRVANGDFLPIYGLPYAPPDPQPGDVAYWALAGSTILVNDAGTAVANPQKVVYCFGGWNCGGQRAVRWDASTPPIELGNLGTGFEPIFTLGTAINKAGTIVGAVSRGAEDGGAVRWDASGTAATELGKPSGFFGGAALAINDAGIIVGEAERYASTDPPSDFLGMRALRWDPSSTITELGHLGSHADGWAYSSATAINNAGTIIGASNKITRFDTDLGRRAVRWNAGATAPTELGNLGTRADAYAYTEAVAINDAGTIAGNAEKYDAAGNVVGSRAVRWDASVTAATELGDLGPQPGGGAGGAVAWAINDAGTIMGEAGKWDATGRYLGTVAVRWDALDTAAKELGNLGITTFGESNCFVRAMNDAGTAVGGCNPPDAIVPGDWRAVYFRAEDGAAIDLNTLIDPASGWLLERALGISDTGWIVGMGLFDADGPEGQAAELRHYLIHVPATAVVPEPESLALCVSSLWAIGIFALRKPCRVNVLGDVR
jgi:uncharacterized membrane protein